MKNTKYKIQKCRELEGLIEASRFMLNVNCSMLGA